jgi:hypothetical protein
VCCRKECKAGLQQETFREQKLQKQPNNLQFPDGPDSYSGEASIEVKSQLSNVIEAGFVDTHDSKI